MSNAIDQNKGPFLNDIETGQRFIGYFVLRRKQLETFRDPSRGFFLSLILSDRSGQRLARVWEDAENTYKELEEGQVLKVDGETEEYLDRIQIRVHRVRPAKEN
jgi:23S rRNA maturation-related 3'-5' exoribonuclease YhaM